MRKSLERYLYENSTFEVFGVEHLVGLFVSVLLIVLVPWVSLKYCSKNFQARLGMVIGYVVMLNYPIWVVLEMIAGTFNFSLHLPVHL